MQKKIENKWFEKLEIKVNNKLVEESKSLTTNDNNVTSDILFKETNSVIGELRGVRNLRVHCPIEVEIFCCVITSLFLYLFLFLIFFAQKNK